MVRAFGTYRHRRGLWRAGLAGVLLASTALVGLPEARAAGELIDLSTGLADYFMYEASGVSGDGRVVIGTGYELQNGSARPLRLTDDGLVALPYLDTGGWVEGINRDGTLMVGSVIASNGNAVAAIWNAEGAMSTIGTLHPSGLGSRSAARDVSGDGSRVVGWSFYSGMMRGFVWIEGATGGTIGNEQMYRLPGLPAAGRWYANAISDNGLFAVGQSNGDAHLGRAVRWDLSTIADDGEATILDLGSLTGMQGGSEAQDVSADGRVVVGESVDADGRFRAFRWVEGATTGVAGNVQMHDLGTLGGSDSIANAVSRNGAFVVGQANLADDETALAFRWTEEGGMESVGDWLARHGVDVGETILESARGISDDGNVVVGGMRLESGDQRAYLARVGDGGSGVMDVAEYQRSLFSTTQIAQAGEYLTWLPLNGAHHRPLMSDPGLDGARCAWATGDLANHGGSGTGIGLAEMGGCVDLAEGRLRIGAAMGTSRSWQALALGGSSRLAGQYVLGEVDWRPDGTPLLLSLTGMLGGWQADLHRGYANGAGVSYSDGSTGVTGGAVRMRVDWLEAATIGATTINPWVSVAAGQVHVAGFTEQGGAFPAAFGAQTQTSLDARLGVAAVTALSDQLTLTTSLELAYRGGQAAAAQGTVAGLFDFDLGGGAHGQGWARVGAELDYQIHDALALSGSLHLASNGRDPSVSGSIGLKATF